MITRLLSLLHRLCIPRPVCCFLAGVCSVQVLLALVTTPEKPLWVTCLWGVTAVWSIISWVWTTVWRDRS